MKQIKIKMKDKPLVALSKIAGKIEIFDGTQTAVGFLIAGVGLLFASSDYVRKVVIDVDNAVHDKMRKKYSINENDWIYLNRKYIEVLEPEDFE